MAKSSPEDQQSNVIDPKHSACLCDVGLPDYVAATAVDNNGNDSLWLARKDMVDAEAQELGNARQPHEQLGRLPGAWRERIWGDLARCGRATAAGKPCRRLVGTPGEPCGQHKGWEQ